MDSTQRQITKIAREVNKFTVQTMKAEGIGTAEFDIIHYLRHHPGSTQAMIREKLQIDKGAIARQVGNLENKGFITRVINPHDGRSQLLYATEKANTLRNSKSSIEATYYQWLLAELADDEKDNFCKILNKLYLRSKQEARSNFNNVKTLIGE